MDLKLQKRVRKFLEQNDTIDINNAAQAEALIKGDKKLLDALEAEFFIGDTEEKSIFSLFKSIATKIKEKIVVIGSKKGGVISYVINKRKEKYPTAPLDPQAITEAINRKIEKSIENGEAEELEAKDLGGGKAAYEHQSSALKQEPNKKGNKFKFYAEGKFTGTLEVARMDKDGNPISGAVDVVDFVDGKVTYMFIATEGICRIRNIDELAAQAEVVIGEVKKPVGIEIDTQTEGETITKGELKEAKQELKAREGELAESRGEIETLRAEQEKDKKILHETQVALAKLKEQHQQKGQEGVALQADIEKMTQAIKSREAEIKTASKEARELQSSRDALQHQYAELESKLNAQKTEFEVIKLAMEKSFSQNLASERQKVSDLEEALEKKAKALELIEQQYARDSEAIRQSLATIKELGVATSAQEQQKLLLEQEKLRLAEQKAQEHEAEAGKLQTELAALRRSHEEKVGGLETLVREGEGKLVEKEASLREQEDRAKQGLEAKESELTTSRQEIERIKAEQLQHKQEMEAALERLRTEIGAEKESLTRTLEGIRQKIAEGDVQLKAKVAEHESAVEALRQEKAALEQQQKAAGSRLLESQEALSKSQDALIAASEENIELSERIAEMEDATRSLEGIEEHFEAMQQPNIGQRSTAEKKETPTADSQTREGEFESIITKLRDELNKTKVSEAAKHHLATKQEAELERLREELSRKDQEAAEGMEKVQNVYQEGARAFQEKLKGMRQTQEDLKQLRTGRTAAGDLEIRRRQSSQSKRGNGGII